MSQNQGNPTGDLEKEEIICEKNHNLNSSEKVVILILPRNVLF